MLTVISHMSLLSERSEISNQIAAYYNFLQAKERAGLERGFMSKVFAQDKFDAGGLKRFTTLIAEQTTYTSVFLSFATPGQRDFYKSKMQGNAVEEAVKMRAIAFERAAEGKFGVEPGQWFKLNTEKIGHYEAGRGQDEHGPRRCGKRACGKSVEGVRFVHGHNHSHDTSDHSHGHRCDKDGRRLP